MLCAHQLIVIKLIYLQIITDVNEHLIASGNSNLFNNLVIAKCSLLY